MRVILSILFSVVCVLCPVTLCAQSITEQRSDTLIVYFKVNKHDYNPAYMENGKRMEDFIRDFNEIYQKNTLTRILELNFKATSSPEGRYEYNKELSKRRAATMEDYFRRHTMIADSALVISSPAEAWAELTEKVNSCDMPWKEEVLRIINDSENRKKALMELDGGRVWKYMLENWFPKLRQFTVIIKTGLELPSLPEIELEIEDFPVFTEDIIISNEKPAVTLLPIWKPKVALKSNLIGWGLGHANLAVEVDLAPHWSVSVPFYYSGGFDYFKPTLKFRGIVLQPEARYYFKGNYGWYIGAHLGLGWYNFALDGDYRIQDHKGQRPAWGGGVGAGYSLRFKHNPKWGMEFSVGAGAYDALYDVFYNEVNGAYAEKGVHKVFYGIDNVSVSFTYRLGTKKKEEAK